MFLLQRGGATDQISATYDETGAYDFQDTFQRSVEDFQRLTATAGKYLGTTW